MAACVASSPSASPAALESDAFVALESNAGSAVAQAHDQALADVSTEAETSSDVEMPQSLGTQKVLENGPSRSELNVDVEAQKSEPPRAAQAGDKCAKWRRSRLCMIGMPSALLVAALLLMLWPKDPTWDLSELHMSSEVLNAFIGVVTGAATITEPLSFTASVHVFNPNLVGTTVDKGAFTLTYKGAPMGGGTYDPIAIGGRSSTTIEVYLDLLFTPEVGQQIMQDALNNDFQIVVDADVKAVAHAGFIDINAAIQCSVTANTLQMLEDPNNVLGDKRCNYQFRL